MQNNVIRNIPSSGCCGKLWPIAIIGACHIPQSVPIMSVEGMKPKGFSFVNRNPLHPSSSPHTAAKFRRVLMFKSHMVQIKLRQIYTEVVRYNVFKSHMVQIKLNGKKKVFDNVLCLNPTWFR